MISPAAYGKAHAGLGKVGTDRSQEQVQWRLNLLFFQPEHQAFDIVIQVSNFSFREGGITGDIFYGDTKTLIRYVLKELLADVFVIGGFIIVGLYSFIVFATRRKDYASLLVAILALGVACRSLFMNGYLSEVILGIRHWGWLAKLEYTSELVAFLAAVLLMKHLYPQEVHRYMVGLSVWLTSGLFVFVMATSPRIFTESMLLQTAIKGII